MKKSLTTLLLFLILNVVTAYSQPNSLDQSAANFLRESGKLYVVITNPDGSPVAVEALGSGTFVTRDGETKPFTKKINVDYVQSQKKTVSFDWKQNSNFQTGNYKIEVFNNGFKVGEAYRPLKKGGLFS